MTNGYGKLRNKFKIEKFVVLAGYLEQQPDCNRYKKNQPNKKKSFVEESIVFAFPFQTYGNHATELSTFGHVI